MSAPLADVRIVAVEQYGAGPWATMQLADLGADVVKVEDPAAGGDVGRYVPPYAEGESSLFFESFNRGKRSVALDLRDDADKGKFHALVAGADAVFSNLRGDVPERLGLTYAQLAPVNPRLVCCSLSAFGMTGPRARQGGYDFTIQGLAGWQSITGEPDGAPSRSGLSLVDFSGGYLAAIGLIAGIHAARRDGVGCDLDLSLFETALSQLNYMATWSATHGRQPVRRRRSAHQSMVPFQNFPAADGWMVVACPKQGLWLALCRALERDDLATDPRFADFAARDRNRDELEPILDAIFATRPVAEWEALLTAAGVPCARINTVAEALADQQVAARELIQETEHPVLGTVRQVRSPFRFSTYAPPLRRGPFLGEHSAALRTDPDPDPDPITYDN
jgi:crotonobetainyl-CoA:carnitine CoA-transferase CaiB-like acyl-CoA transferase